MARDPASQQTLQRAFAFFQQGRLAEAEKLARRAAALTRPNAELLLFIAILCTGQNKHAEAVALCTEAVQLAPRSGEAHYNLGTALMRHGRGEDAIASLQKAVAILPSNYDVLNNLGNALIQARRLGEAEKLARKAIALAPGKPAAHHTLGVVLRFQDRFAEAIESLQLAMAKGHPDPSEVNFDLGQTLLASSRVAEAIAHFREALKRKSKSTKFLLPSRKRRLTQVSSPEAAASYEAALALAPDDVPALVGLANARLQLADWHDLASLRSKIARAFQATPPDANPFTILTLFDDPEIHCKSAQRYAGKHPAKPMAAPAVPRARPDRLSHRLSVVRFSCPRHLNPDRWTFRAS